MLQSIKGWGARSLFVVAACGGASQGLSQSVQPVQSLAAAPAEGVRLRETTVTATRTEREVDEVPATVTVIEAQKIERGLMGGIRELVRDEPGVSAPGLPGRFGAQGFNIRGLEGNRILIQVDGVRQQDAFSIGSFSNATRDTVDLEAVKRVEILRGPGSSLYGSDALGGVVSYVTKDPDDLLSLTPDRWTAAAAARYTGTDNGVSLSGSLAGRLNDELSALLVVTQRRGEEVATAGSNSSKSVLRTAANPQDTESLNVLGKFVLRADPRNTWKFTVEVREAQARTDVLSLNLQTPRTTDLKGDDLESRSRLSLEHEHRDPAGRWFQRAAWAVFLQDSRTYQITNEIRSGTTATCSGVTAGANNCYIPRSFLYDQRSRGANAQLESNFQWAEAVHRLTWGFDYVRTQTVEERDATRYNLTTGTVSKNIAGDTFPVRDTPGIDTIKAGLYLQDEIAWREGRFSLVPGLRWDTFRGHYLSHPDFTKVNANFQPVNVSESALSPKLGAVWKVSPAHSLYGQYARGFRAPPIEDVNFSFQNAISQYTSIPNPNLKKETSDTLEAGLRYHGGEAPGALRGSLAGFYSRYKDFILSRNALNCPGDPRCVAGFTTTFQSINISKATIFGLEATAGWRIAKQWDLSGSFAWSRGENEQARQPLNSVQPLRLTTVLAWAMPSGKGGARLAMNAASRKTRVDDTQTGIANGSAIRTPGYAVFDLTAHWTPAKNTELTVGLFNLGDRRYLLWNDVAGALETGRDGAILDRYSQPGRFLSASIRHQF